MNKLKQNMTKGGEQGQYLGSLAGKNANNNLTQIITQKEKKNMRKSNLKNAIVAAIIAISFLMVPVLATAADKLIQTTVQDVVKKLDKNGNPYVRIMINEKRSLNGVEYEAGVMVMAFSETVAAAEALQKGQEFKAVVAENDYRGNKSYVLRAIVK